jgi:hypothetical protein
MAQTEPLPLVPATVMMGQFGVKLSAVLTAEIRANPMSMVTGWVFSK